MKQKETELKETKTKSINLDKLLTEKDNQLISTQTRLEKTEQKLTSLKTEEEKKESEIVSLESSLKEKEIQRPPNWGGYIVQPIIMEFWQGRPSRLHDRIQYTLQDNGGWKIERLAP